MERRILTDALRMIVNKSAIQLQPIPTVMSSFLPMIKRRGLIFSPSRFAFFCTAISSPKDASDVFRQWGCTEADIHQMFTRFPPLRNSKLALLQSKLSLLSKLGVTPSDLVGIIHHRPCFLHYRADKYFDGRLDCLEAFFGSREMLIKAIVRNPSLLSYDFQKTVAPVAEMYARIGVPRPDLISLMMARATLIPRSKLCQEKLDYICRTRVSRESKLYKHVVKTFAISRIETVQEKLGHFQKFGFSEDEVLALIGRSPFLLTLSTDKVHRNMNFVVGILNLQASVVLDRPYLLYLNLETTLKPMMHLAFKIGEMNLLPKIKGPGIFTALRMKEKRFIEKFIMCHPPDVSKELMVFYTDAKDVKGLALSSKNSSKKGFPM